MNCIAICNFTKLLKMHNELNDPNNEKFTIFVMFFIFKITNKRLLPFVLINRLTKRNIITIIIFRKYLNSTCEEKRKEITKISFNF